MSNNLIEASDLQKLLDSGEDVLLADCRFDLGDTDAGQKRYAQGHLPGALYFHLENDLSAPLAPHGGRHPLPTVEQLAQLFSRVGLTPQTWVVAYDDDGAMASRLWWLLRYLGHERVKVLNGGVEAWKAAGYPLSQEVAQRPATSYVPRPVEQMLASREEVLKRLGEAGSVLIDSREGVRYRGEKESIDPVAGHIPGAQNFFWKEALAGPRWKSPEEQRRRWQPLLSPESPEEIIVYCGSGVTACANLLSLEEAGIGGARLYAGSWSDWISYEDSPIATGEE